MTEQELIESRNALADEVERMKMRIHPPEVVPSLAPKDQFCVADVMPEMVASMARQRAKWAAFCESIRPDFDALPESKACPHHPTADRTKLFEETCQQSRVAGEFRAAWAPCGECDSAAARTKQRAFWRKRGVPERVIEATLSNFVTDTEGRSFARGKVCEWQNRNGVFLLLRGTAGTGKGHLASGVLKIAGNGLWITHANMLSDLRTSYTLHTTKAVMAEWQEAECLVIDELGVSPGGRDEETMFYQVLADRHDKRLPTVLTTNLESDKYRAVLGHRLMDRIGEDCVVVQCAWASWRTKK